MLSVVKFLFPFSLILIASCGSEQEEIVEIPDKEPTKMYFPPASGSTWETIQPSELGWSTDEIPALLSFVEQANSRAFIVLKDGKIVIEAYFGKNLTGGTFTSSSNWYWASAGKTLTSTLVGLAQEKGFLKIEDVSSKYLGKNWTSLPEAKEQLITIRNQLTMTTGLDDGVENSDCTLPKCMVYKSDAGTRWAYHNAPYTILDKVIESATKQSFDTFFNNELKNKIGMDGQWNYLDDNHVYFSTARSMARFGHLILNNGDWDGNTVISDKNYVNDMVNTSQNINPSYGYLWWLNGKSQLMVPTLQTKFNTPLATNAPSEMYAAIGKNGQLINIIPSQNIVVIRMGESTENGAIGLEILNNIWEKLNKVIVTKP
jgi:CubicO group peptidase (beta-lactamase class C family)